MAGSFVKEADRTSKKIKARGRASPAGKAYLGTPSRRGLGYKNFFFNGPNLFTPKERRYFYIILIQERRRFYSFKS